MKKSVILFIKNGVEVRTQFIERGTVNWFGEEKKLEDVLGEGFIQKEDIIPKLWGKIDSLYEKFVWGHKITNQDFLNIKSLLDEV